MNPAVPGHAEPAAAPGPAVEEEPEPRTPAVGAPRGGGVIAAVGGGGGENPPPRPAPWWSGR